MDSKRLMACAAGLALVCAPRALGAPQAGGDKLHQIAADYDVQVSQIEDLRDKGWSWNEIGNAMSVSKRSGQPLDQIVGERDSGRSWDQISQGYGFRFKDVKGDARHVAKEIKRADHREPSLNAKPPSVTPESRPSSP